ncbi:hypothetical protein [Acinetobacter sp. DSM 11652]|uniref:hypothetical protein n=1 Tax=Acinetobacter sp. DSM 11652 TaxID=346222 RepID=UPI0008D67F41|nr:hypothetical protein [Acinetobacter sp. DSM 11652]SEL55165.1 hypothetical protein SAMN05216500_103120 [Acinetobacter sp. DSM 11652]
MIKIISTLCLLTISSVTLAAGNPTRVGDVLGRDLNVPIVGALGHTGVYVSSNNIVQVMNKTAYVDVIEYVSLSGFKTTKYWGAKAKTSFGYKSPYSSAANQITAVSNQQRPHVAYTLYSATPNPAVQVCSQYNSNGACSKYTWQKGTFRCDSFTKWLYTQTGNGNLGGSTPRGTFNSSLLTITRV